MSNDIYAELKSNTNIITIANELGFNGTKSGNFYQGNCPGHPSKSGKCLSIFTDTQRFKCFNCGENGDVIDLVEHYNKCDHIEAYNYLADKAGMPHLNYKNLSPEELARRKAVLEGKILVESMLTTAAEWYHDQLNNYPEIKKILLEHYGFSEDIINEHMIGYAPESDGAPNNSEFYRHMNSIQDFKGKLHLSGLFGFNKSNGNCYDLFNGRIIFPYLKNGKVVYMAGRKTDNTPVNKYEGAKYKKLCTHKPGGDNAKYISKHIQNDTFIGEDSIRGAKEIIITEGIPDAISALDNGFKCISPATISFSNSSHEKLEKLTKHTDSIYIVNDNEENKSGEKGAMKTGKYLAERGRNVFIVELPLPEGADKIDLNEYLKSNSADDLRKVMKDSKSVIDFMIDNLPDDFQKAEPTIIKDIIPVITGLSEWNRMSYMDKIKDKCGIKKPVIDKMYESVSNDIKLKELKESADKDKWVASPKIKKKAEALAKDPLLFRIRIDAININGIAGERKVIGMYYATIDSRLLLNSNPLALKNAGIHGAGKSYSLEGCTELLPKNVFYVMTDGSSGSLHHFKESLAHKVLIVNEAFEFQTENADSKLFYALRSLISEGEINYWMTIKKDGDYETINKHIEGPTAFITTTTTDSLEPQFDDRLFVVHPDESKEQTKAIIEIAAEKKDGTLKGLTDEQKNVWITFHDILKPVKVKIPFAKKISNFVYKQENAPLALRRGFNRILTLIEAVTCTHQFQRKTDDGYIIAEYIDYWIALQLSSESFNENMGQRPEKDEKRLSFIKDNGLVQLNELHEKWGVSRTAISNWISKMVREGTIRWCKENGDLFADNNEMNKEKSSGNAYLKVIDNQKQIDTKGLPTVFEITGDDDWDVGGELYKKYDLRLDLRNIKDECSGVQVVTEQCVNTPKTHEPLENTERNDDKELGVQVFSPLSDDKKKEAYIDDIFGFDLST